MRVFATLLLAATLAGCAGPLDDAMGDFRDARYPEAVQDFRRLEPTSRGWPAQRRARYALYRGLTHLALGDARPADFWLGYAKALSERQPGVLDTAERGRLVAAWRSMGHMPGEDTVRVVSAGSLPARGGARYAPRP